MAVSTQTREIVRNNPPPSAGEIRKRAGDFMARSGMGIEELASEIDYSYDSVRQFFRGSYESQASTDVYIRYALTAYMDSTPLPGVDEKIPERLIPSWDTKLILECCDQAREESKVIAIEGPPGTSKTVTTRWYAANRLKQKHADSFWFRACEDFSSFAVLRQLAKTLGVPAFRARDRVFNSLVRRLCHCAPALILVDEAQRLTDRTIAPFEALRDVIDEAHCGCILAGHFNFFKSLSNGLGQQLEQWLRRIPIRKHLRGLQRDELGRVAREYFGEGIDGETLELVTKLTQARDRNAILRARYAGAKFEMKYLNFRRVSHLFNEAQRLRALPGNERASLRALIRAASRQMMEAM